MPDLTPADVQAWTCRADDAGRLARALLAAWEEINQLRFAILGGEDVPGYAANLPLSDVLTLHATYIEEHGRYTEALTAERAKMARLVEAWKEFTAWMADRANWLKYEREHGGDTEHLFTRERECRYIIDTAGLSKIAQALRDAGDEG
jgi:hypothetical protein